jgi:hypothetical protein
MHSNVWRVDCQDKMAAVRDEVASEGIWPSRALRAWTAEQALPRDQERAFELGVG